MATYKKKKNLWEARRRVTWPDGTKSRESFYAETEEEAEELADNLIRSLKPPESGTPYINYATYTYAPSIQRKSENWRDQVVWANTNWIFPRWGHIPIESIKRKDVQAWFDELEEKAVKGEIKLSLGWSIVNIRKVFRAVMELAVFDELINRNPVYRISVTQPFHEPTIWTPRQLARLILCSSHTVWGPAILTSGALGVRIGESIALAEDHVNPDEVKIDWQVLKEKLGPKNYRIHRVNKLKTPGSHRRIPLPEGFYSRLLSTAQPMNDLIGPNRLGGLLDPENASRAMSEGIRRANATITEEDEAAGLGKLEAGTFHDLRHTLKAILEDLGCPAIARRMILGHAGKDAHDKYGKAFDQTVREHLGTILKVIESEECLLAVRPKPGVQKEQEQTEFADIPI